MAKVAMAFLGVPDGEIYPRRFEVGDEVAGDLEAEARLAGWLEKPDDDKGADAGASGGSVDGGSHPDGAPNDAAGGSSEAGQAASGTEHNAGPPDGGGAVTDKEPPVTGADGSNVAPPERGADGSEDAAAAKDNGDAAGAGENPTAGLPAIDIPPNWADLHHNTRKKLARQITGEDAADAAAADAVIADYLARKRAASFDRA